MIELYFMACLISEPAKCRDVSVVLNAQRMLTPQQCEIAAQVEMAKYFVDRPGWYAQRHGCRRANRFAKT
jgi:hypothetical protein